MRRASRGFTLLEAIVTLVIVSLLVTMLMQALGHSLQMRSRIFEYGREVRLDAVQQQWFRDSVTAALPDIAGGLGDARGDAERFSFLTAAPLGGRMPRVVEWRLVRAAQGTRLEYLDPELGTVVVLEGPLEAARFSYKGRDDEWLTRWQPEAGDPDVLPRLVKFEALTPRGTLHWVASVASDPTRPRVFRIEELGPSDI